MLIVVAGSNYYACRQQLDGLLAPYQKESFAVAEIDLEETEEPAALVDQVANISLFATTSVYVVRGVSDQDETVDLLTRAAANLPESSLLIIYAAGLSASSRLVKALQALGAELKIAENLPIEKLVDWVSASVEATGGKIDRRTARHLVDWVGEDQLALANEIEKLVLFDPQISFSSIEEVTAPLPKTTIFNLLDAMVNGRQEQAAAHCRSLFVQRIDPNYVMSMICWQAHIMSLALAGRGHSVLEIAKSAGVSSYALERATTATRRIDRKAMAELNEIILEGDRRLKNDNVDKERLVEQLVSRIALLQAEGG